MGAHELLLLAALALPLVATAAALAAPTPSVGREVLRAGCVFTALAWAVLTALGPVTAAGFHTGPLLAAACCGAALLAASVEEPADLYSVLGCGLALAALNGGLSVGTSGEMGLPALGGLTLAAGCTIAAAWEPGDRLTQLSALVAATGVAAVAGGLVLLHRSTGQWALATDGSEAVPRAALGILLLAAGALAASGGLRPRRSPCILLAGALALGLVAAPLRGLVGLVGEASASLWGPSSGVVAVVVLLTVAALVAAAGRQAPLALALLGLAVAAGPFGLVAASRLLAAAAVIALAVDERPAWLVGVPGGAALAEGAIELGGGAAVGLAVAAGVTAALLAWNASIPDPQARWGHLPARALPPLRRAARALPPLRRAARALPPLRRAARALPAAVVGVWLFVAPGSWEWVGPAGLGPYDEGAAAAVAFGLIVVGVIVLSGTRADRLRLGRRPRRPPGVEERKRMPPTKQQRRPPRVRVEAHGKGQGLP